ncbi:MAG: zinc ABC transporter substrate-binding protein [Clostridia bacterium]|nr:zinc ABC transporter substrate-binding protein [Clostridia bacterium]
MKKFIAMIIALSLLFTAGCGAVVTDNTDSVIAVSFYPIYIFTLNLTNGIDGLTVTCMAEQSTGCLHDYTLTARDAKLLNDADVFVINGAGLETFLDDVSETTEDLAIVDSSEGIELLCSHHHEGEEHTGHNHESNSHIWLSVENAKKQVLNIKNGLVEKYPQYEKQINQNYEEYIVRLNGLSDELKGTYQAAQGQKIITFHAAYEYMAAESGLEIVECIESDEGGEPSAKKIAHLCDVIPGQGIKALFVEPDYNGSAAEIMAAETGVKIYVLNPVTKGEVTLGAYEDIMRENIQTILKAVS